MSNDPTPIGSDNPSDRKFLVFVDETPECEVAIYFASRRAKHTHGIVVLLYVIPPADFQHWGAVEDVMRDEAHEEARARLRHVAEDVQKVSGRMAEIVIREGQPRQEIQAAVSEDKAIKVLVLGAAVGKGGGGPLINAIATGGFRNDADFTPVPLTLVPGSLSHAEIDVLA